jgi:hypothetical protein
MPMDAVIQKLYATTFHPETPEPESVSAMRILKKRLNQGGSALDYEIAPRSEDGSDTPQLHEEVETLRATTEKIKEQFEKFNLQRASEKAAHEKERAKTKTLRAKNKALRAEHEALRSEHEDLRAKYEDLLAEKEALSAATGSKADTGTEYINSKVFEEEGDKVFACKGWRPRFASAADIDLKELDAWRVVKVVPAKFRDLLPNLTDEQKAPASRMAWSDAERKRLMTLVSRGLTDREIAKVLSKAFGRRLVETSITGARRRFKILRTRRQL